jgi:hypothetical protein
MDDVPELVKVFCMTWVTPSSTVLGLLPKIHSAPASGQFAALIQPLEVYVESGSTVWTADVTAAGQEHVELLPACCCAAGRLVWQGVEQIGPADPFAHWQVGGVVALKFPPGQVQTAPRPACSP